MAQNETAQTESARPKRRVPRTPWGYEESKQGVRNTNVSGVHVH